MPSPQWCRRPGTGITVSVDSPPDSLRRADQSSPQSASKASEAEGIVREKIRRNWSSLRGAFRALDRSNNGFVSRADFMEAMRDVFLMDGFTQEDVDEVAELFDLKREGNLSYEEFAALMDRGEHRPHERTGHRVTEVDRALQALRASVEERFNTFRAAFRTMDKNRTCSLTKAEFEAGVRSHGIQLTPEQLEDLRQRFDSEGTGFVGFARFCKVLSQVPEADHIARQMYQQG